MNITQIVGIIAGILTAISMLPQLIKMIKEKKAEDISILMLIVLLSGLSLWIVYGIMREDLPIIATNAFSVLINITLVILRIKYSGTK
jgi:MtN3 and saliva related transmembrane protein